MKSAQTSTNIWPAILSFVVLFGGGYFLWLLLQTFFRAITHSNPSVAAAIIGAMATAFVGIGGVLLTQLQTKKRTAEEAHRPRKVEIYQQFLEMISRIHAAYNDQASFNPPTPGELVEFMVRYKSKLVLWASPEVLNAQLNFESASQNGGNVLVAVDKLYLAIRADLGLSNNGLQNHQLVKLYLKDPTELDASLRQSGA